MTPDQDQDHTLAAGTIPVVLLAHRLQFTMFIAGHPYAIEITRDLDSEDVRYVAQLTDLLPAPVLVLGDSPAGFRHYRVGADYDDWSQALLMTVEHAAQLQFPPEPGESGDQNQPV